MKATKPQKPSRADLERKILELEALQPHRLAFGQTEIDKASVDRLMGSGVILSLTVLGGKQVLEPVCIRDGLSKETIAAIKADMHRSFEVASLYKTKA